MPGNPQMRSFSQTTLTIRTDGRTDKNRQTIAVTLRLRFVARVKNTCTLRAHSISIATSSPTHHPLGIIHPVIWALCLRPFNELASIDHQRATKKNMDCAVSIMLLGIMVLSHLPRDSKGEDSCNTGISVATY